MNSLFTLLPSLARQVGCRSRISSRRVRGAHQGTTTFDYAPDFGRMNSSMMVATWGDRGPAANGRVSSAKSQSVSGINFNNLVPLQVRGSQGINDFDSLICNLQSGSMDNAVKNKSKQSTHQKIGGKSTEIISDQGLQSGAEEKQITNTCNKQRSLGPKRFDVGQVPDLSSGVRNYV